jgi:hypothetical protein
MPIPAFPAFCGGNGVDDYEGIELTIWKIEKNFRIGLMSQK